MQQLKKGRGILNQQKFYPSHEVEIHHIGYPCIYNLPELHFL